jgi:hypothetical protein
MTRALALLVLALVLLAGCGSAEQPRDGSAARTSESASPTPSASVDSCDQSEDGFVVTRNLAKFDVNGDGTRDRVGLVEPTRAGCAPEVAVDDVVGSVGPGVSTEIPVGEPPVRSAFGVVVPGRQGALVVTKQIHPRGGFQLRVFALDNGVLAELKVDGHPLVPFVALDVQEHPLSVDCADGGLVITEAVAHEPVGVMFAWDVRRTSYAVNGNQVARGATTEVADNVLPNQLEKKYPELVGQKMFASCRAA